MIDIVLVGATGFAGRRVARHLHTRCHAMGLRLALAGRSMERLESLRAEIHDATIRDPELRQLDLLDGEACLQLARATRVVLSTVGPYQRYGSFLVAACAEAGTDYADLTGEVPWIREMIDAHDAQARRSGARIIHACGFDSVPSDLGVLTAQDRLQRETGTPATCLELQVGSSEGGFSRGTIDSLIGVVRSAIRRRRTRAILSDVHSLEPDWAPGLRPATRLRGGWRTANGRWALPFVMEGINARVVHRSHALAGFPWGDDFSYRELIPLGRGLKGLTAALLGRAAVGGFLALVAFGPTRRLVEAFLPAPGTGPAVADRGEGYFRLVICDGRDGRPLVEVAADRDPGYGATAIMLAEAGLLLAGTTEAGSHGGGVLTPAAALGSDYATRLTAAGVTVRAL